MPRPQPPSPPASLMWPSSAMTMMAKPPPPLHHQRRQPPPMQGKWWPHHQCCRHGHWQRRPPPSMSSMWPSMLAMMTTTMTPLPSPASTAATQPPTSPALTATTGWLPSQHHPTMMPLQRPPTSQPPHQRSVKDRPPVFNNHPDHINIFSYLLHSFSPNTFFFLYWIFELSDNQTGTESDRLAQSPTGWVVG